MIAIETRQITKAYGDLKAVDEVSITVNKGEIYGLLGMNGAGKSTLIQMLCGLVKPTSGEGSILGYDLIKETNQVKEVIAVSPQETAIAPNLTVRENLELLAGLHGFTKKEKKRWMTCCIAFPWSLSANKEARNYPAAGSVDSVLLWP